MIITRKIGKILRGKATPFQIVSASVLGAMIGFVPGFWNGPGLTVALLLVLLVLNANLGIALLVAAASKLLCWLLLPVSFGIGRFLMDGPLEALFRWIVNTPVLALFGLDHYATTGGMVLGIAFGIIAGLALLKVVRQFRKKMAKVEEGSERYQKWATKPWVKALAWILIGGGHGRKTYAQLLEQKRIGNPVRIAGVVAAVVLVVVLVGVYQFASGPVVTMAMQRGLERANGATVDMESAELDLAAGKLHITGLAVADPNALDEDLLRAKEIEANVSGTDLLRKRITMDRLVLRDAVSGAKRDTPGKLVGKRPEPTPQPEDEKTVEDYIEQAKTWKQRLAQLRDWLERLSGPPEDEDSETWQERIKRRAEELGYARVIAMELIEQVPSLTVTELEADGVRIVKVEDEVFDIRGKNLSTHPHLIDAPPQITVTSRSGNIAAGLDLAEAAKQKKGKEPAETPTRNAIRFVYKGMPTSAIEDQLKLGGDALVSGGTFDIDLDGSWTGRGMGDIAFPLIVTMHDVNVQPPGGSSTKVSQMTLPIGLTGPLDNPAIYIDRDAWADAFMQAGLNEYAGKLRDKADELTGEVSDKLKDKLGDKLGDQLGDDVEKQIGEGVGGALEGLLGGNKKKKDDDDNE